MDVPLSRSDLEGYLIRLCVEAGSVTSPHVQDILLPLPQDPDNYNASGLLKLTDWAGIHECDEKCEKKCCKGNMQARLVDSVAYTSLLVP